MFGFGKVKEAEAEIVIDPTAWMLENPYAEFVLMHTFEIKFMCMIAYCFVGGCKVWSYYPNAPVSYKFVHMIMTCTGGGILVPIFLNKIPVSLALDYYLMAIMLAFSIHQYFPVIREVYKLSTFFKLLVTIFYEIVRGGVVKTFYTEAVSVITPSALSFPLFGPIICATIAGCGGAFFPLSKGLDPIKSGLGYPIVTALVGSSVMHIFLNTDLSEGIVDAKKKSCLCLTTFFIVVAVVMNFAFQPVVSPGKKKN